MAASSQTQSDQARETGIPVLDRYIATDAYREQISLVKNRIDLYALTVFGGQLLVSLGGVLLFSWLIIIGKAHLT